MPAVSVIIPAYNRLSFLREAVDSVLTQSFSDFELLIIDDGSTDGTGDRYRDAASPIRYVYQEHSGVSAARNRGISESSGRFIAFLDSDDRWLASKLAEQYAFMAKHPDVLMCHTGETWIRNSVRVNPGKRHLQPPGNIFDKSLELCIISPSTVMIRREFFDEVGFFDERLPVCEDYDLWLRATCRMDVPLIPHALTVKRGGHDDQLSKKLWGMDRFRVYALQKLLRDAALYRYLTPAKQEKVITEIRKKCDILITGALKRKRYLFALKGMLTRRYPYRRWGII